MFLVFLDKSLSNAVQLIIKTKHQTSGESYNEIASTNYIAPFVLNLACNRQYKIPDAIFKSLCSKKVIGWWAVQSIKLMSKRSQ